MVYNFFLYISLDSTRDVNIEFKIRRLSTPSFVDINEYIPSGHISSFIPSKVARTIYLLPKINPEKEWEAGSNWDYSLDYENIAYRNSSGNYNGVTNAPIYLNYTNYANYSGKNNSGTTAGYPNMNSQSYPGTIL
jgi:hypothetical protein